MTPGYVSVQVGKRASNVLCTFGSPWQMMADKSEVWKLETRLEPTAKKKINKKIPTTSTGGCHGKLVGEWRDHGIADTDQPNTGCCSMMAWMVASMGFRNSMTGKGESIVVLALEPVVELQVVVRIPPSLRRLHSQSHRLRNGNQSRYRTGLSRSQSRSPRRKYTSHRRPQNRRPRKTMQSLVRCCRRGRAGTAVVSLASAEQ